MLDPFAGRGTAIFSAATKGRNGMGVELNPVGWVYSQAKLMLPRKDDVIERIREIGRLAARRTSKPRLPVFFSWCFSHPVQQFLLTARKHLDWRQNRGGLHAYGLVVGEHAWQAGGFALEPNAADEIDVA